MWFIGKLSRDKRGAGSIVGAVFMLLILLTGFTYYFLNVNVTEGYTKTVQDMQQLDLKRNKENIEFTSISITSDDKLNITMKNTGSYQVHLIWLGVFNKTSTPETQQYYQLDENIDPTETETEIGSNIVISEGSNYVVQLVTERGNIIEHEYPTAEEEEEEGTQAHIAISGLGTIPHNTWTSYTITVTSETGDPFPYAYISVYTNGTDVKLSGAGGSDHILGNTDENGEYMVDIKSSNDDGEAFVFYAVVGSLLAQKNIYQEPK